MTSSLVGSEMCIRDSALTRRRRQKEGRNELLLYMHDIETALGAWEKWWAVSYTHLTLPTICSV
eukprot:8845816-Prorocentrum_lima.AAC.1